MTVPLDLVEVRLVLVADLVEESVEELAADLVEESVGGSVVVLAFESRQYMEISKRRNHH